MKTKNFSSIFIFLICGLIFTQNYYSQEKSDTLKNYWLNQVEVSSKRVNIGTSSNKISKDNLENILGKNGFSLIRKGVFFAQDIYSDGLKRGDINVVVDGERYHSACPNRMDSPLTRINPLELESVNLIKGANNIQSSLGGVVNFKRSNPSSKPFFKVELSSLMGAQYGVDFAGITDFDSQRISLRYAKGSPFEDSKNNSFKDNYGFKNNYDFTLAEGSLRGKIDKFTYGASFSYTENVSFPYLLMDERKNRVYSAHLRYNKHKVYFNYTDHIMDNDLRVSKVLMRTSTKNLTIGAIGNFYEIVYRNWDANNFFKNAMVDIKNDLMPNVSSYMANIFKSFKYKDFDVNGKLGFVYSSVGEKSRKDFYNGIYNDVDLNNFFPIFAINTSYQTNLFNALGAGAMLEANSEAPEIEALYIAVQKPMGKPTWSGNPNLRQPVKFGFRGNLVYDNFSVELFVSRIQNYYILVKKSVEEQNYLSYSNIDAQIYGTNILYSSNYIEFNLSYNWAKNITDNLPLAEIQPLTIKTKLISPKIYNLTAYLKHSYNDAQTRVYDLLNERSTPAWNKFDVGVNYSNKNYSIYLDVENVLNEQYYQHLSYLRDPFSANNQVYEPGRVIRLTFKLSQLL